MNFGKLNKRLVIKGIKSTTSDSIGGRTETTETKKTTWGSLRPVSAKEAMVYGLEVGSRAHECTLRYDENYEIDQNYWIEWTDRGDNTRTFRIVSVIDVNEAAHEIKLLLNERTD